MKRIKMMLLSLALFAVVGGALAFKAKFHTQFCTGTPEQGKPNTDIFCPNHIVESTFGASGIFVATTTYDGNNCESNNLKCTTTARTLTIDTP